MHSVNLGCLEVEPTQRDPDDFVLCFPKVSKTSSCCMTGPGWCLIRQNAVQILLDRLKNDVTRLPAVKALAQIAQSPLQLSLAPHVKPLLAELISFLRKANRPLRQASLATLNVSTHF